MGNPILGDGKEVKELLVALGIPSELADNVTVARFVFAADAPAMVEIEAQVTEENLGAAVSVARKYYLTVDEVL